MRQKSRILVIEDDADIQELIQFNLENHGYNVTTRMDGEEGLAYAFSNELDLLILDIMLPGIDGISVLREIRGHKKTESLPVIMLSAKGEESDVVVGLELGADDYMAKPFSPKELYSRIKAILRRSHRVEKTTAPSLIETGPVQIDIERHEVRVRGELITFTLAEFNIIRLLASRPGRVYTRDQILEFVSGGDTYLVDRNVDVHVRSIRKKLGQDKDLIETIRGVGYKCRE